MNKNMHIAILSDEWLLATGLKSILTEQVPLAEIMLFSCPEEYRESSLRKRFNHTFSFKEFKGIKTEIIDPKASENAIRSLLRRLFKHETYADDTGSASRPSLTKRETEVLRFITQGLFNKEIADRMKISLHTVISHRKNITSKLGIKTVSGLTIYAIMHGIT